jgi:hypothetical protein
MLVRGLWVKFKMTIMDYSSTHFSLIGTALSFARFTDPGSEDDIMKLPTISLRTRPDASNTPENSWDVDVYF